MQLSFTPSTAGESANSAKESAESLLTLAIAEALTVLSQAVPGSQTATQAQAAATRCRDHQRVLSTAVTQYAIRLDQVGASFAATDAAHSQTISPLLSGRVGPQ